MSENKSTKPSRAPEDLALNMPSKKVREVAGTEINWKNWRNWLAVGIATLMVFLACYFSFMDIETRMELFGKFFEL